MDLTVRLPTFPVAPATKTVLLSFGRLPPLDGTFTVPGNFICFFVRWTGCSSSSSAGGSLLFNLVEPDCKFRALLISSLASKNDSHGTHDMETLMQSFIGGLKVLNLCTELLGHKASSIPTIGQGNIEEYMHLEDQQSDTSFLPRSSRSIHQKAHPFRG